MLPAGLPKRRQYNDLIDRGVQLLREQDQLKDDIAQLKQEVEEEIGKDFAKEFKKLVNARYKNGKVQQEAEAKLEMLAELDVLAKCAMEPIDADNSDNYS